MPTIARREGRGSQSAPIRCDCSATDAVGDFVYITGDKVADRLQVAKADIADGAKSPAFGMIISKPNETTCDVQTSGPVAGVYTGFTPNEIVFVGPDGRLTETSPEPGLGVTYYIQIAGVMLGSDEIDLRLAMIPIRRVGT